VYRGEVHTGEHEPILDRDLFAAVQAKLAANAVARKVRLRGSVSILTGRIYDDRGNCMSPTHSNKLGMRYRYYVSHALLQNRKEEAGSVTRVPAPEIEQLVLDGVRAHLRSMELPAAAADRDLIERHVDRVILKPQAVEVRLMQSRSTEPAESGGDDRALGTLATTTLTLPWVAPSFVTAKSIVHNPP
jgi:site-specific DNA recombinase